MVELVKIILPGEPVAKARPRARRVNGQIQMYTPQTTAEAEKLVGYEARKVFSTMPLRGPVLLRVDAFFGVRKSWSKKKKTASLGQPHVQKPDWDNLGKLYADALNGIIYEDDAQVFGGLTFKWWGSESQVVVTAVEFKGLGDLSLIGIGGGYQ